MHRGWQRRVIAGTYQRRYTVSIPPHQWSQYPTLWESEISEMECPIIWTIHGEFFTCSHSLKVSAYLQLRNCTCLNYKWLKITAYAATQKICFLPLGLSDDSPTEIHEKNLPPEAAGSRTLCIAELAGLIQELPRSAVPEKCHSVSPPTPRQASVVDRVPLVLAETTQWISCNVS